VSVNCVHAKWNPRAKASKCALGLGGGTPSRGWCASQCTQREAIEPAKPALFEIEYGASSSNPLLPGNLVGVVLKSLGYPANANCDCAEMRGQMNAWGWQGCIEHREELVAWFCDKARKAGAIVAEDKVRSLIFGGFTDRMKAMLLRAAGVGREVADAS
jgi:hypothetical protein